MSVFISGNKKKALAKAKFIINIDLNEEEFSKFNINSNAIIINIYNKTRITAKNFNGINILDYNIEFDYYTLFKNSMLYDNFDRKDIYETILQKGNIDEQINNSRVRITKLVGKNGVINTKEFASINSEKSFI